MKLFSLFFLLFFCSCFSQATSLQKTVEVFLKKSKVPLSSVGLWIFEDSLKPKVKAQINEKKLFIPASVTKLVTVGALFSFINPKSRFETTVSTLNSINSKGLLKGDLYLKGGGDPTFVSESMWSLVHNLKRTSLKEVHGDIIIDQSYFGKIQFPPSRTPYSLDEQRAYKAPISALSFNWNSVAVHVRPGKKAGDRAKVFLDPSISYIKLINKTKTVPGQVSKIYVQRRSQRRSNLIIVKGRVGLQSKEKTIYRSITHPSLWVGGSFKHFLKEQGIKVTGGIKKGRTPKGAFFLAQHKSRPLFYQIQVLLKYSNNFVSDILYQNLYEKTDWNKKLNPLNFFMTSKLKLKVKKDFYFESPSGLNRKNKVTPEALGQLLVFFKNRFGLFPEVSSSLPIAAVDGTLKDRMVSLGPDYGLRMKTGLLNGVVSLAGYFQPSKKENPLGLLL